MIVYVFSKKCNDIKTEHPFSFLYEYEIIDVLNFIHFYRYKRLENINFGLGIL